MKFNHTQIGKIMEFNSKVYKNEMLHQNIRIAIASIKINAFGFKEQDFLELDAALNLCLQL